MNSQPRPEFIRLPANKAHCPFTGLKRGTMRNLTLPSKANNFRPPVPAKILKQRGKLRGVVLIPYDALIAYLEALPVAGRNE